MNTTRVQAGVIVELKRALELPIVGSHIISEHGIDWLVDGHVSVPTIDTLAKWRSGETAENDFPFPSIIPQNFSPRLMDFIAAVDRCTAKHLVILDTVPGVIPKSVPGNHWLDTCANSNANLMFVDAACSHETIIAHEIGHAWVQYVELAEDERVFRDCFEPLRIHQLNFVQSFVLDHRVNEVIREKGFDMSIIEQDERACMINLEAALRNGYRPETPREDVFMALLIAAQLQGPKSRESLAQKALEAARRHCPALGELATTFAEAVITHGHVSHQCMTNSINDCLLVAFEHTGDPISLDRDLFVPQANDRLEDKFPNWLAGLPIDLKLEVGRVMARERLPNDTSLRLSNGPGGKSLLEFEGRDGSMCGPWILEAKYPRQHPCGARASRLSQHSGLGRTERKQGSRSRAEANTPMRNAMSNARHLDQDLVLEENQP